MNASRIYRKRRTLWIETGVVFTLWLILLILSPLGWGIDWPVQFWIKQVIFALTLSVAYFVNSFVLVPRLVTPSKFVQYGLILAFFTGLILVSMRAVDHGLDLPRLIHKIFHPEETYHPKSWFRFDLTGLLMILLAFGASTSISLIRKDQKDSLERQELEKEKVSTELSFLKAQINPHFFFNTLNNIYALTSLNVESAQKAIHMLSAMMRYVLYDSRKELTTLSQEIRFVENYIELMRLRLPEKVTVIFEKPEDMQQELIAPMLLLPYVENAFKHGISSQQPCTIYIQITVRQNLLNMHVKNTVFETNSLKLEGSGIGMANTQRRLELMYPGKHRVDISKTAGEYLVNFKLNLAS